LSDTDIREYTGNNSLISEEWRMKDAAAWRHGQNLFAVLFLAAFMPVMAGCQHGPYKEKSMTVAYTAPYESGIEVRRAVRKECDLERRVAHEVASEIRGQVSAMKRAPVANADTPGLALDMKIINVEGGVGAARGNKTLTVAGTLYEDGKVAGSFTATRRTRHGRHTCRMLWENIEEIAEDVSRWMAAPTLDAYLGDARPGDFEPPRAPEPPRTNTLHQRL
jgi:hypothetical protein